MKLLAAKMLLSYADREDISIQLTTGTIEDIVIDCTSNDNTVKLLEYAHRTNAAKNVKRAIGPYRFRLV